MLNYFFRQSLKLKNQRKIKTVFLIIGFTVLLTGCHDLNSQFTCPRQPGVNCQSLDQVNTLIDQGKLNSAPPLKTESAQKVKKNFTEQDTTLQNLRTADHVMRLWIAPYTDTQGNYFSANRVYHVIERGQWREGSIDDREMKSSDRKITTSENPHV